jgi:hypothetical protein
VTPRRAGTNANAARATCCVEVKMVDQGKETPSEFFERLRQERWKEEAEAERRWMDDEAIPYEKRPKLLTERDRAKEKLQKKVNAEVRKNDPKYQRAKVERQTRGVVFLLAVGALLVGFTLILQGIEQLHKPSDIWDGVAALVWRGDNDELANSVASLLGGGFIGLIGLATLWKVPPYVSA